MLIVGTYGVSLKARWLNTVQTGYRVVPESIRRIGLIRQITPTSENVESAPTATVRACVKEHVSTSACQQVSR